MTDVNVSSGGVDDPFGRVSPVACWKLNLIGVYCILLFSLSICVNGVLTLVFYRVKELRSMENMFFMCFTFLSLLASLTEAPFVIVSNFYCRQVAFVVVIVHLSIFLYRSCNSQMSALGYETGVYDENTWLGFELTKQVEFFQNFISIRFPGSSKQKVIFRSFLFDRLKKV